MDSGPFQVTKSNQTPNAVDHSAGVRQWGISFIVERERTQTARSGPKITAKWKRKWRRSDSQEVGLEAAIL